MAHTTLKMLPLLGLLLAVAPAEAQKKKFTIAEATNGLTSTLAPESIKQPSWQPGRHNFWYKSGQKDVVLQLDNNRTDTLSRDQAIQSFTWLSGTEKYAQVGDSIFITSQNGDNKKLAAILPAGANNITPDPLGKSMAFTVDNNLLWIDGSGKLHQVTQEKDNNIISGQAVHRNEFGIEKGIFFSPQGNLLAFYHMDQTMVSDYPVIDWSTVPAQNKNIKYPMAGRTSHQVTVRIYNPANSQTTILKTGEPKDQYLTSVTWSPDEKYVFVTVLNRGQNHLWLNQYDAQTGEKIKTLFEEQDEKYVEPQNGLTFLPGSQDQFIWWSQRDGYMHLYLYNTNGKLIRQLTKGNWIVNELIGFYPKGKELIITAAKESPLEKHGYAVNWANGKIRRLDSEPGVHTFTASEDGAFLFDVYSSASVPKRSVLRSVKGDVLKVLSDAPNTLADYDRPEIRSIILKADDGTPLYGKLILPTSFDSTRKYPVIVYLYNGPHVQLVQNRFPESGNLWYEYMAQRGYIVFTMDGRGSSNRGLKFEQVTFRQLGTVEMDDQLKGVDYLKSLPYVDAARMGVHGWSFGGFMTTSLMLRHPGVFACAVAGGPVLDWSMYEIMYTERYMDTPEENPQGYADNNLLTKVSNLQGKLLLIHGAQDDVVVWQHSINFIKKCVDAGVQIDYFVYPGHPHNVRGKDRVHLMQKISDYFDLYLKK